MSKLDNKFLQNYSIDTLRDVEISGLVNGDYLIYDSVDQKFKNQKPPRFGIDFIEESKVNTETTTGASFVTYSVLNFSVSLDDANNKYRLNADFLWSHNSASNDIRVRVLLDGNPVKEIRIEPKDAGADQRFQNNILYYANDLTVGNHSFALQYRPATASRISSMYESVIECWRVN